MRDGDREDDDKGNSKVEEDEEGGGENAAENEEGKDHYNAENEQRTENEVAQDKEVPIQGEEKKDPKEAVEQEKAKDQRDEPEGEVAEDEASEDEALEDEASEEEASGEEASEEEAPGEGASEEEASGEEASEEEEAAEEEASEVEEAVEEVDDDVKTRVETKVPFYSHFEEAKTLARVANLLCWQPGNRPLRSFERDLRDILAPVDGNFRELEGMERLLLLQRFSHSIYSAAEDKRQAFSPLEKVNFHQVQSDLYKAISKRERTSAVCTARMKKSSSILKEMLEEYIPSLHPDDLKLDLIASFKQGIISKISHPESNLSSEEAERIYEEYICSSHITINEMNDLKGTHLQADAKSVKEVYEQFCADRLMAYHEDSKSNR